MVERIDFYILEDARPQAVERFTCRLVEKAFEQKHTIYLRSADEKQLATLDQLLWTFRQGSFLPHATAAHRDGEPIVLGMETPEPTEFDLLVNLAADIPTQWEAFHRLAEIVGPAQVEAARGRFRHYRRTGIEPHYHKLASSA